MAGSRMEILFVTWDGGGNVPPAIGIATELQRRGHGVRFLGHASQAEAFARTTLDFQPFRTARAFSSATPWSTWTLLGVFDDRAMGRDVLDALRARPADVVVVDCLLFGVMRALRQHGREYVVVEHSLDGYFRRAARGPLGLALRLRGCRALSLLDAGRPVLTTSIPSLDADHGDVHHIGPVLSGLPAGPVGHESPAVLLSLSTAAFGGLVRTWQRVLDAVDGLPVRVIATTGPAVDPTLLRIPPGVEHHRWLPHEEVLPDVSLVVGHGGHGTSMAALGHDVPVVVLPVDTKTDQPYLGAVIERAGAGRLLRRRSSPARIRAAIEQVLADSSYGEAAARLGAEVRAMPGATQGADAVERLLKGGAAAPDHPAARP